MYHDKQDHGIKLSPIHKLNTRSYLSQFCVDQYFYIGEEERKLRTDLTCAKHIPERDLEVTYCEYLGNSQRWTYEATSHVSNVACEERKKRITFICENSSVMIQVIRILALSVSRP